jgi:hypothetical protein
MLKREARMKCSSCCKQRKAFLATRVKAFFDYKQKSEKRRERSKRAFYLDSLCIASKEKTLKTFCNPLFGFLFQENLIDFAP